jgi:hypothetical protein
MKAHAFGMGLTRVLFSHFTTQIFSVVKNIQEPALRVGHMTWAVSGGLRQATAQRRERTQALARQSGRCGWWPAGARPAMPRSDPH